MVIGPVKLLTVAAGSGAGTLWNWGYSFADGAGGWSDAGAFVALGPCSVMPGTNATAGDHGVLLQVMQNNSAGTAIALMFQPIINSTVGPSNPAFKVRVKSNGTDGGGLPLYDLYALADTGYATKLNLSGAMAPLDSRARWQTDVIPTAAPDGSVGDAFYAVDGTIRLDTCPETLCTST